MKFLCNICKSTFENPIQKNGVAIVIGGALTCPICQAGLANVVRIEEIKGPLHGSKERQLAALELNALVRACRFLIDPRVGGLNTSETNTLVNDIAGLAVSIANQRKEI